jgi:hypothetical protein
VFHDRRESKSKDLSRLKGLLRGIGDIKINRKLVVTALCKPEENVSENEQSHNKNSECPYPTYHGAYPMFFTVC